MQNLLKQFNLPYSKFESLLVDSHGMVAGGAALYAYLHPHDSGPTFTGDIDIWIHTENRASGGEPVSSDISAAFNRLIMHAWNEFLSKYGYKYTEPSSGAHMEYRHMDHTIHKILRFNDSKDHKIQIILTYIPTRDVCKTFDLSVCATWWTGGDKISTLDPENTAARCAYPLRPKHPSSRETERIEKYRKRGFTVFDAKPTSVAPTTTETW